MNTNNVVDKIGTEIYRLLGMRPTKSLLASSIGHLRHPLPADHSRLIDFEKNQKDYAEYKKPSKIEHLKAFLLCILFSIRESLRIIFLQIRYRNFIRLMQKKRIDVIVKTWYFNEPEKNAADFYFGELPRLLREQNLNLIILAGNFGKLSTVAFAEKIIKSGNGYFPEKALIPFWIPFFLLFDQAKTTIGLSRFGKNKKKDLFSTLAAEAAYQCLTMNTMANALQKFLS